MAKGKKPKIDPNQKYEHPLEWTEPMFELVQKHAVRFDCSLSFIVQTAWKVKYPVIAAADRETLVAALRAHGGKKVKQGLFYMGSMILQFGEQAARVGESESFVVQAAVALAIPELEKMPSDFYLR
jgi:hypothetical protein